MFGALSEFANKKARNIFELFEIMKLGVAFSAGSFSLGLQKCLLKVHWCKQQLWEATTSHDVADDLARIWE